MWVVVFWMLVIIIDTIPYFFNPTDYILPALIEFISSQYILPQMECVKRNKLYGVAPLLIIPLQGSYLYH